jgi:hypothetical protein
MPEQHGHIPDISAKFLLDKKNASTFEQTVAAVPSPYVMVSRELLAQRAHMQACPKCSAYMDVYRPVFERSLLRASLFCHPCKTRAFFTSQELVAGSEVVRGACSLFSVMELWSRDHHISPSL